MLFAGEYADERPFCGGVTGRVGGFVLAADGREPRLADTGITAVRPWAQGRGEPTARRGRHGAPSDVVDRWGTWSPRHAEGRPGLVLGVPGRLIPTRFCLGTPRADVLARRRGAKLAPSRQKRPRRRCPADASFARGGRSVSRARPRPGRRPSRTQWTLQHVPRARARARSPGCDRRPVTIRRAFPSLVLTGRRRAGPARGARGERGRRGGCRGAAARPGPHTTRGCRRPWSLGRSKRGRRDEGRAS